MTLFNVINTGSSIEGGNAVTYFNNRVLVDVGTKFSKKGMNGCIEDIIDNLELVLLTHKHGDHVDYATIKKIQAKKPSAIFVIPEHLVSYIETLETKGAKPTPIKNKMIIQPNVLYQYKDLFFEAFPVHHDVPNVGYHIYLNNLDTDDDLIVDNTAKVIHMTDTEKVPTNLKAPEYEVYALEQNLDEEHISELIDKEIKETGFSHRERSIETHLSSQKAQIFIDAMKNPHYGEVVPLHMSGAFRDYIVEQCNIKYK